MRIISLLIQVSFILSCTFSYADGVNEIALQNCGEIKQPKRKAKDLREGSTFMVLVMALEEQGKRVIRPEFEVPNEKCLFNKFESELGTVQVIYSPWSKGIQTINYQFTLGSGEEKREFLILYNGMASLISGQSVFYVSETYNGNTKFYAAYKSQPRYKELKALIQGVLMETKGSIIEVTWPEDSEELIINKYDSDQLK